MLGFPYVVRRSLLTSKHFLCVLMSYVRSKKVHFNPQIQDIIHKMWCNYVTVFKKYFNPNGIY